MHEANPRLRHSCLACGRRGDRVMRVGGMVAVWGGVVSAKRRAAAARRVAARRAEKAAELEQLQAQALALAQARLDRLYDPSTPAAEIAELVWEQYEGAPVLAGLAALLTAKGSSGERLAQVAEALDARGGADSLTALTFRALAAHERGEAATANQLTEHCARARTGCRRASRVGAPPALARTSWRGAARPARTSYRSPDDDWAVERYGVALEAALAETSPAAMRHAAAKRSWPGSRIATDCTALPTALEQYVPHSRLRRAGRRAGAGVARCSWSRQRQLLDSPVDSSTEQDADQLVRLAYRACAGRRQPHATTRLTAHSRPSPTIRAPRRSWRRALVPGSNMPATGCGRSATHTRGPGCGATTS